jgi:hypothetical protein
MEDLKKYLSIAAKHSFWIISGLILILASVFFYLTKSELDQAITSRVTALTSAFNTIKTVSGKTSTHPNKHSHDEMERRRDLLKADVDRAWEFQYDRQKRFLTWPAEAFADEKTLQIFDSLRPFEANVPFPLPDKLPPPLDAITRNDRAVYKGYIAPEFPALARMIGSTWKFPLDPASMNPGQGGFAPPPGGGGFTPPGFGTAAAAQETKDLVRWSEESQKALATAVLPWFGRATPPDIHEIYYAQEDIWILRGLMDIIAQTNAGANENFQAIVKEIEWIRTGPRVSRDAGSLAAASSGAAAGGAPYGAGGAPSGYAGGGGGGMPSGYGGMGGMGGKGGEAANAARAATRVDPADNRYVDANLKAVSGAQLRTAIKDRDKNQDGVAKRVQVRMRVKVDERFGKLITECGNGKMMLEVLQVRYNTDPAPDQGGSGGGGGGGGAAGGGAKPSFGGAGLGAGSGAGMMSDGENSLGSSALQSTEVNAGEISIEIYGLIYLFNPPPSLNATNPATPAPAGGPPAAAPAANPPAANPPAANPPAANPPAGEVAEMETPAGETPAGEPPAGDTPAGEPPAEEPPAENAPAGEEPPADPGTDTNPPPSPPEPSGEGGGGLGS